MLTVLNNNFIEIEHQAKIELVSMVLGGSTLIELNRTTILVCTCCWPKLING